MNDNAWKKRLVEAIEAKGSSLRSVSLAAGKGPGYIHSLLAEGKDPSITNLLMVCDAAAISGAYVLFGLEADTETQELIRKMQSQPGKRDAILKLLDADAQPPHD